MKSKMILATVAFAGLAGFILVVSGARVKDHHDPISRRLKYISGYKQSMAYLKPDPSRGISSEEVRRLHKSIVETERDLCMKLMRSPEKHDPEAVAQCKPFQAETVSQTQATL